MKIRHQLIVSHTVLTFSAVLILTIAAIITQQNSLQQKITELSKQQVENVNNQIDSFLSVPMQTIEIVSSYIENLEEYDRDSVEAFLDALASKNKDYTMLYVSSATPTCNGGFTFTNIHWLPPADFDETTRSWFKNARDFQGTVVFSNPYIDEQSKGIVVTLSKSFRTREGAFGGVVGIDLILDKVVDMVHSVKLTENAQAFMIDENGLYVTNPDTTKDANASFYSEHGFSELAPQIPENTPYINMNASKQYFAARKMPNLCGWTLVSFGPKSELYSDIYHSLFVIVTISVIALIVAILCSLIISVQITHPLKHITIALNEISGGHADLTKRLNFNAKNEIGEIARGFNSFTQKLQEIVGQLKKSKDTLSVAGEDLVASTSDTSDAIGQILGSINSVTSQIHGQGNGIEETASVVNQIASNIQSLEKMIVGQAASVTQASAAVEEMIGNIESVNTSIEKMAASFDELQGDAQNGTVKQQAVNERITQIETQSQLLQEANTAISTIGEQLLKIRSSIEEVVQASLDSSESFSSVSTKIKKTDQLVRQIKSAMEEQKEGSKQIINALHEMNDTTSEVKSSSREMGEGNKQILGEVEKLQNSSAAMNGSMDEMGASARKINETGSSLTEISAQMKNAITEIGNQINEFTV